MSTQETHAARADGTVEQGQSIDVEWVAQALAPEIRFHSKEQFWPCSVEWFLRRSMLTLHLGDLSWDGSPGRIHLASSMSVLNPGPLKASDLVHATSSTDFGGPVNEEYGTWPMESAPGQPPSWSHPHGGWYFSDYQLETLRGELTPSNALNPRTGAACYAHIAEVTKGEGAPYFLISYYFFCAYNGAMGPTTSWDAPPLEEAAEGGGLEQHYCDIMRVAPRVRVGPSGVSLLAVEFDAHGVTSVVSEPPFSFSNRSLSEIRPLTVYSAWHSHEMYPKAGKWSLPSLPFIAHDYTDDGGLHWRTRPTLVFAKAGSPEWIDYNGRMGNNLHYAPVSHIADILTRGPVGPAFKDDWPRGTQYSPPFPFSTPYQSRILEVPTTFGNETDGTWLTADFDGDGTPPDLVFIKTANTPNGHVEVHVASGASNYQKRILEVPTTFGNETDGTWLMADFDHDGIPDLVFIKTANTPSNRVEVHVASGASNYQKRILEVPTTFGNETDGTWLMGEFQTWGLPDLVFIKTANTPNGHVEVHVAPGT